jgi:hypothetical protein
MPGVRAGIFAKNVGEDADVASWKLTPRSYPDHRPQMDNAHNERRRPSTTSPPTLTTILDVETRNVRIAGPVPVLSALISRNDTR